MEIAPAVLEAKANENDNPTTVSVDSLKASSSSLSSPRSSPEDETRSPGKYDEEEDEGDVCRICRNPGDAENPLRYPCACSGSIKFVHQDCLLQWLNHSNARQCEVRFSFIFLPFFFLFFKLCRLIGIFIDVLAMYLLGVFLCILKFGLNWWWINVLVSEMFEDRLKDVKLGF